MVYNELTDAFKLFHQSDDIIITTHEIPDGDAIGSVLALYFYGKTNNKKINIILEGDIPEHIKFINGSENIIIYDEKSSPELIKDSTLLICLDLNESGRLGKMQKDVVRSDAQKIVIDHHFYPKDFADIYCIDSEASSTGELIWDFFNLDKNFILSKEIASALYLAIMTDTGSFRFQHTDKKVHYIVSQLIEAGADPVYIYNEYYNRRKFGAMKLFGEAILNSELYFEGKVCIMSISQDMFKKYNVTVTDTETFVESTLTVDGVEAGVLLIELSILQQIKLSFRSKNNISVREIARKFSGGGHFNAAGAKVDSNNINKVKSDVIEVFREYFLGII